jgi:predicted ATP-dependent serine protease
MTKLVRALVCTECAKQKANWVEDCPHAIEHWRNAYSRALQEHARARLNSEDVRRAISGLSPSWENFYHLAADTLNRILDEKEKTE